MGSEAPGLISELGNARCAGQHLAFCLGAVQRPAARPDPSAGSWVRAFVCSARRAAQFYGGKVTQARDLTSKLANDDRDEDREGVYGFESRAARARQFAAEAGLTAYALMAAAEGAIDAYTHITGEKWKPYEPPVAGPATVGRQAAEAEIAAFG